MTHRPITPNSTHEIIMKSLASASGFFPYVLDLERSHGNRLYDSKSGRYLLDCFSFIASNPLGFNHPKMNDPAFERTLLRAAKIKPSNSDILTTEMAEFVSSFANKALPKSFCYSFFVEGGALANENALKTAFDWKVRLNFLKGKSEEQGGKERGSEVIHFKEAFHGRSGYTLSLTNTDPVKTKYFPKFPWPRVHNPKLSFPITEAVLKRVIEEENQSLQEIKAVLEERQEDIAAIIIEPIQGEGGDNHFRPEFHQALRKIADQYSVLLIYDEVQSGMGLTGKMWAFEHFDMQPDLFSFGKKSQVCGFASTSRIDSIEKNVFHEPSRINSTWGGSLVDMIRVTKYLEIMEEDQLVENVEILGKTFLKNLENLQEEFPQVFSNARGRGFMCSIDLPSSALRSKFVARLQELGAIILTCGERSLRFRPALTFSMRDIQELFDLMKNAARQLNE
jgi:L-lysine 6-transaminase